MSACTSRLLNSMLAATMAGVTFLAGLPPSMAADHGDGPFVSGSAISGDTGDSFLFLDPNDNSRLVIAMTLHGFIPAGEAVNFSVFDHLVTYGFELETTGDARPDRFISVTFSRKVTSGATPQTATITIRRERPKVRRLARFRAPTTPSNLSATSPTPVVTSATTRLGVVDFFAGEVDDPFNFDIPGFARFVASVLGGSPNPALLQRGRDSFAGYNNLAIALRFPVSLLGNLRGNNIVGLNATTRGFRIDRPNRPGRPNQQLDRSGNPAVNVALIPFALKDAHNRASTLDDAAGRFAPAIIGTLRALGTNQAGIDLLASLAVTNGDFLRVNLGIPNTGPGGGDNAAAAFPNGRRLGDNVITTILAVVSNGAITTGTSTGPNEQPLRDVFPFFPPTHQPFTPGPAGEDDRTRN